MPIAVQILRCVNTHRAIPHPARCAADAARHSQSSPDRSCASPRLPRSPASSQTTVRSIRFPVASLICVPLLSQKARSLAVPAFFPARFTQALQIHSKGAPCRTFKKAPHCGALWARGGRARPPLFIIVLKSNGQICRQKRQISFLSLRSGFARTRRFLSLTGRDAACLRKNAHSGPHGQTEDAMWRCAREMSREPWDSCAVPQERAALLLIPALRWRA